MMNERGWLVTSHHTQEHNMKKKKTITQLPPGESAPQ